MSDEREKDRIAGNDRATGPNGPGAGVRRAEPEQVRALLLLALSVVLVLFLLAAWGTPYFFQVLALVSLLGSVAAGLTLLGRYWRRKMAGQPAQSRFIWRGAAICICITVYVTFTPTRCAVPLISQALCESEERLGLGAIPRWVNTSPD